MSVEKKNLSLLQRRTSPSRVAIFFHLNGSLRRSAIDQNKKDALKLARSKTQI